MKPIELTEKKSQKLFLNLYGINNSDLEQSQKAS